MKPVGILVLALLLGRSNARGAAPDRVPPIDFKLVIENFGVRKEPLSTAELVVHNGRAFQFISGPSLEIVIHDLAGARLELVDLERKARTEVSLKKLDAFQVKLHDAIAAANSKRKSQGGRANEVAAAMSQDLIEPRFASTFEAPTRRLRLTNATVEVEARGDPEPDKARLSLITSTLAALTKLEALRDPSGIPPFSTLEALQLLTVEHGIRPTEMVFLYRLAGPPKKRRWTYHLEPNLTARELEALSRVELMMARCAYTRFELYERRDEK